MLGLFHGGLPITRVAWQIFLTLVALSLVTGNDPTFAKWSIQQDPVAFALDFILLVGFVLSVRLAVLIPLNLVLFVSAVGLHILEYVWKTSSERRREDLLLEIYRRERPKGGPWFSAACNIQNLVNSNLALLSLAIAGTVVAEWMKSVAVSEYRSASLVGIGVMLLTTAFPERSLGRVDRQEQTAEARWPVVPRDPARRYDSLTRARRTATSVAEFARVTAGLGLGALAAACQQWELLLANGRESLASWFNAAVRVSGSIVSRRPFLRRMRAELRPSPSGSVDAGSACCDRGTIADGDNPSREAASSPSSETGTMR